VTGGTRPVADNQKPVVDRKLFTPGQDLIAPPGVSSNKPVTEGTHPVVEGQKPVVNHRYLIPDQGTPPAVDDQKPVVDRRLFTPDGTPTTPTKVGGDPTTGTQIVDSPIKR